MELPQDEESLLCEPVIGSVVKFPCDSVAQFPTRIGAPEIPSGFFELNYPGYENYIAAKTFSNGSRSLFVLASVRTSLIFPLIYCDPTDFFWTGYQVKFVGSWSGPNESYRGIMQIGAYNNWEPGCVWFYPQIVDDFSVDVLEQ